MRRTVEDLLSRREDCYLAAFDSGVNELAAVIALAWWSEREWEERIRACLAVLLAHLDEDPALARLLFVEALAAGPRVLARHARVLQELIDVVDQAREAATVCLDLSPLSAECAVGATWGLIHARLVEPGPGLLSELLNPLMAMIVLPYRGREAAARELGVRR